MQQIEFACGEQPDLSEAFAKLLTDGFELPFTWVVVGFNGAVLVFRCAEGPSGTENVLLARHIDGDSDAFVTPLNVLVVDKNGRPARLRLSATGLLSN